MKECVFYVINCIFTGKKKY